MRKTTMCAAIAVMWMQAGSALAADPAVSCESGKLKVSSAYAACRLKADAIAVLKGRAVDYSACDTKFTDKYASTEAKGAGMCPSSGDASNVKDFLSACTGSVATKLGGGVLIADPVTCSADLDTCNDDLDACEATISCGLRGIGGVWTLSLPDAYPSPDTCSVAFTVDSATTVSTVIGSCGYLGGANATGYLLGDAATAVQDGSPICSGYRLEAQITFDSCTHGSGIYVCKDGGGSIIFTGSMTATRS